MVVNNQTEEIKSLIIKKFEENFANFDSIRSITEGIFDQGWKIKDDSDYEYVMSLLFSKAFKTYKGINILCKEGYGQDAGILLRSLFEIYVNVAYILKDDSEKRAKRYYEYSYIARKRSVELFDEHRLGEKGFKGAEEAIQKNKEEIYESYNRVKNNYIDEERKKDEFRWSGKSIKKMARDCGLGTDYAVVYSIFSELVHSNPMVERLYVHVNIKNREIAADIGPSEEYIGVVSAHGNTIFLRILEDFNAAFNLGRQRKIDELKDRIGLR